MELERPEVRRDGAAASFYASPSSSVARYLSDAGLSRESSYIGSEDQELEICCLRLREVANRIELAHCLMLDDHDRRVLAIAEKDPYARFIPFYPELHLENGQINHTAQLAPCTSSPQRSSPMYHEVPGERCEVLTDLNLTSFWAPRVPSVLRREEAVPHVGLRFFPEPRNESESLCQPIDPFVAVCVTASVQDVRIDNRPVHDPINQNCELPPALVVPVLVQVPISGKKIESSSDKNKKRKRKYGNEVIQIKPTMMLSNWPCIWCSVNFDSKEAMDGHLQEQHQVCKGDGPSESEKDEKIRFEEARNGLTVTSDGCQITISDASKPHDNKKIHLELPPSNLKQKVDELNKQEVLPILERKDFVGSSTNEKIKLVVPPLNLKRKSDKPNKEEVVVSPENKEISGSHTNKKIKLDWPPLNLAKKPEEVTRKEVAQILGSKEIAGSNIKGKNNVDVPSSNSKQKPDEQIKQDVVPTPEIKEMPDFSNNKKVQLDLPPLKLEQKTDIPNKVLPTPENKETTGSSIHTTIPTAHKINDHHEKLKELLNGTQKFKPANRMVTEKPVQEVSQAASTPKLMKPKEETSKSVTMPKPVQGAAQAVSVPKLVKPKDETSQAVPIILEDKPIEATSHDKGSPSSRSNTVILRGYRKTAQPTAEFSDKNKYVHVNGATKPELVMQDGQWICNLCQTKKMSENVKEHHMKSKTHKQNLHAQSVSCIPEPAKPVLVMQDGKWFCNLCQTKQMCENVKNVHIKSKRHKQNLQAQAVSCSSEPAKLVLVMQDGKWFCNLCQTKSMCERTKEDHIKSKRHKQNLQAQAVSCRPEPAKSVLIMTDGKWFCNLCGTKSMCERTKEHHIKSKRHKQNLEAQSASCRPEPAKSFLVMADGKWFCNLCQTKQMSETIKDEHIKGKKHTQNLQAQSVSCRPEPAKPPAKLYQCFICNIVCATENKIIAHFNEKTHQEALRKCAIGAFSCRPIS